MRGVGGDRNRITIHACYTPRIQNLIKKRHLLPNHILSYIFASTKLQISLKFFVLSPNLTYKCYFNRI